MERNNTFRKIDSKPIIHIYEPTKVNKSSTIYQLSKTLELREPQKDDYFTDIVKIEKYQGYSNAYNVSHYFRLRDTTNWSTCTTPTGLIKTTKPYLFRGDIREKNGAKTLLIFRFQEDILQVFKYPKGYNPKGRNLDEIINSFNNEGFKK